MGDRRHDLIVIGGGPGGYVAAIRAAQLGLDVGCIEREPALGGTCVRVGCIPSKVLLEASERYAEARRGFDAFGVKLGGVELDLPRMHKRKDDTVRQLTSGVAGLFKKNKITRYSGSGTLLSRGRVRVESSEGTSELSAEHVVLATGSKVAPLRGVELDGDRIGTSTEALSYPEVPGHLVVIGAGFIGLELGSVWQRLGAKVTVLEYLPRILPGMDSEIALTAQKILSRQGLEIRTGTRVTGARREGDGALVGIDGAEPIACDRVLLSVGRVPNTDGLGLEKVGIELDERGRIPVGAGYVTRVPGIYAIGDVIAGPMLAHKASEEGVACVEYIVKGWGHVNYDAIPGVCYTHPEIASVGKTEDELIEQRILYRKGSFPFMANGRAKSLGSLDGQVKILAHAETDRVLGVHIIGARAGELIAEAVAAIEFGASAEDLARTCHAHPTLSEVMKEAALAVDGRAIHI
ncbi:MAG: dihydrolipoyl dehydrogenase [Sorangiineae bacterium PRO1]|nr:dihydrolipoyl dehydrogenase [Sorangiineae bacterium PRO1]